jgi:N-acetylglucosaminyldiphosphoundecaprenol N-acetyl-beta-D-mannosaminyltransferase
MAMDASGEATASSQPALPTNETVARRRVRFGHIWVDALTFAQAIDEIERLVQAGRGGAVFTPNVDHVVQVEKNLAFREAYRSVSLSLVDGQPLIWASRLLGAPLPEKISGSDLIPPLMRRAAARGFRVYLLGGPPGVGAQAAEKIREQFEVNIVGIDAPHVAPDGRAVEEAGVLERITAARPHLVLVAFGAPKQELFIDGVTARIRPAVAIGIGAGLDFVAGRVRRAPRWVSQSGFEWLFRLAQEPRRLARRYLIDDPKFAAILYRTMRLPESERVELRSGRSAGTSGGSVE